MAFLNREGGTWSIMELEIRHIRILLALTDELNFTPTAARLGIPQAALSTQISRIERHLGVKLFTRTTRSVVPTDSLEALLPLAKSVEAAMHELERSASRLKSPKPRTLRIGIQTFPLSVALDRLLLEQRDLLIVQVVDDVEANLTLLRQGELDIVQGCELSYRPLCYPRQVRVATVAEEPLWVVMHGDHRMSEACRIDISKLSGEAWASGTPGTPGHDLLLAVCGGAGYSPDIRYLTDSSELVTELLRRGRCIGLASPTEPCPDGCVMRPLDAVNIVRRIVLAWDTQRCSASMARTLLNGIRQWYENRARQNPGYWREIATNPHRYRHLYPNHDQHGEQSVGLTMAISPS